MAMAEDLNAFYQLADTFKMVVQNRELEPMLETLELPEFVMYFWAAPIFYRDSKNKLSPTVDFEAMSQILKPATGLELDNFNAAFGGTVFLRILNSEKMEALRIVFTTLSIILQFLMRNKQAIKNADPNVLRKHIYTSVYNAAGTYLQGSRLDPTAVIISAVMRSVVKGRVSGLPQLEGSDSDGSEEDADFELGRPSRQLSSFQPQPKQKAALVVAPTRKEKIRAEMIPADVPFERYVMFSRDELGAGINTIAARIAYLNKFSATLLATVGRLLDTIMDAYTALNLPGVVNSFKSLSSIIGRMRGAMDSTELKIQKDMMLEFETGIKREVHTLGMRVNDIFVDSRDLLNELIERSKSTETMAATKR